MLIVAIGAGALYLPIVAMTEMAGELGGRQIPSSAYTLAYIGAGIGGVGMGWLADRIGPRWPASFAGAMICLGSWLAANGDGALALLLSYAIFIGLLGHAGTFAPLVTNVTRWFDRNRAVAVAVVTCGHSLAGAAWPQIYRFLVPAVGWRQSLVIYGGFALLAMAALALLVRMPAAAVAGPTQTAATAQPLPYPSGVVMTLLCAAILGCCAPMAIPLVNMVAFCGDLGLGAERGAEAVSLLLLVALSTSLLWGRIADRIGGLPTIFVLSTVQAAALYAMQFIDDLAKLYAVAAVLGLAFIGTVQNYAVVVRQLYGAGQAGWRIGLVNSFGLLGMALGGWIGGAIYDWALSYRPAFLAGLALNLVNLACIGALLMRTTARPKVAATTT